MDALAHTWPEGLLYAFHPTPLILATLHRVSQAQHRLLLVAPRFPARPWFPTLSLPEEEPWQLPHRQDLLSQLDVRIWHPRPTTAMGVASKVSNPLLICCDPAIIETLQSARAPLTRMMYAGRWKLFTEWCSNKAVSLPRRCMLQPYRLTIYALIEDCQGDYIICQFLQGVHRLHPSRAVRGASWDLPLI